MAIVIDGNKIASEVREEIKAGVDSLRENKGVIPGLAVVLVGDRPDSATYVRMKKRAAEQVGIQFFLSQHDSSVGQQQLIDVIHGFNEDPQVHGIIVQLPLPPHVSEKEVLEAVSFQKDVDGFHPRNIGELAMKGRDPLFVPCTPKGCITLLDRIGVEIEGKTAVVVGRSNTVGIPMALLLLHRNATVMICHSKTKDLEDKLRQADIVVAAIGRPEFVRGAWLKPGCVVIDVGINSVDDPTKKAGYRLVGDVAFDEAKLVAHSITPVPGGVGPLTVATLLQSTLESAKRSSVA